MHVFVDAKHSAAFISTTTATVSSSFFINCILSLNIIWTYCRILTERSKFSLTFLLFTAF